MRFGALLAAVVVAAGCGGGGGADDGLARRAIEEDAQARAEAVGLRLSDFPEGWQASASEEAGDSGLRKCVGTDYSDLTISGEARSDDFAAGEATQAFSGVTIFEGATDAETAMTRFTSDIGNPEAVTCLRNAIEESDDEDEFEVGAVEIGALSFTPPTLDEAKAWRIVIPFDFTSGEAAGQSLEGYLDVFLLREGEAVSMIGAIDVVNPFDSALRDHLLAAVASRMQGESTAERTGESDGLAVYTVESEGFSIGVPTSWDSLTRDEVDRRLIERLAQDNPVMRPAIEEMYERPNSPLKLIAVDPASSGGFRANLNVVVRPALSGDTVQDFDTPAHLRRFERQAASFLRGPVDSSLVDLPAGKAHRLVYHAEFQGPAGTLRVYQEQYSLISRRKIYALVYTSLAARQEEYEAVFADSAASFRLD